MKDKDDPMVIDLIEECNLDEKTASDVMYQIRSNVQKYFTIISVQ